MIRLIYNLLTQSSNITTKGCPNEIENALALFHLTTSSCIHHSMNAICNLCNHKCNYKKETNLNYFSDQCIVTALQEYANRELQITAPCLLINVVYCFECTPTLFLVY